MDGRSARYELYTSWLGGDRINAWAAGNVSLAGTGITLCGCRPSCLPCSPRRVWGPRWAPLSRSCARGRLRRPAVFRKRRGSCLVGLLSVDHRCWCLVALVLERIVGLFVSCPQRVSTARSRRNGWTFANGDTCGVVVAVLKRRYTGLVLAFTFHFAILVCLHFWSTEGCGKGSKLSRFSSIARSIY